MAEKSVSITEDFADAEDQYSMLTNTVPRTGRKANAPFVQPPKIVSAELEPSPLHNVLANRPPTTPENPLAAQLAELQRELRDVRAQQQQLQQQQQQQQHYQQHHYQQQQQQQDSLRAQQSAIFVGPPGLLPPVGGIPPVEEETIEHYRARIRREVAEEYRARLQPQSPDALKAEVEATCRAVKLNAERLDEVAWAGVVSVVRSNMAVTLRTGVSESRAESDAVNVLVGVATRWFSDFAVRFNESKLHSTIVNVDEFVRQIGGFRSEHERAAHALAHIEWRQQESLNDYISRFSALLKSLGWSLDGSQTLVASFQRELFLRTIRRHPRVVEAARFASLHSVFEYLRDTTRHGAGFQAVAQQPSFDAMEVNHVAPVRERGRRGGRGGKRNQGRSPARSRSADRSRNNRHRSHSPRERSRSDFSRNNFPRSDRPGDFRDFTRGERASSFRDNRRSSRDRSFSRERGERSKNSSGLDRDDRGRDDRSASHEPRPCRHCGGRHWDSDCPTRRK